ncbi:MAG: hypothetical protein GC165_19005 [Armatimonadetes bacterium]|nr:hypothetical protein [Armatimonadota bacterium]
MRWLPFLVLAATLSLSGCGGGNDHSAPPHTADEQIAVEAVKNLTPEQQIERAQNSPMPQAAKDALIKSIKEKNGMK